MNIEWVMFPNNGKIINLNIYADNEHISNDIRKNNNFYEHRALQFVYDTVPLYNKTVLDIGANIGNHSVFFETVCGAKVIAFEPNDKNYGLLSLNSKNKNITPMRMLIGDNEIYACESIDSANMGTVKYMKAKAGETAIPIDALNFSDVALIKIDVEGMELEVLSGAMQTIKRCSPAIMIEIDTNKLGIMAILEELGYNTYKLNCHSNTILALKDI